MPLLTGAAAFPLRFRFAAELKSLKLGLCARMGATEPANTRTATAATITNLEIPTFINPPWQLLTSIPSPNFRTWFIVVENFWNALKPMSGNRCSIGGYRATTELESGQNSCAPELNCQALNQHLAPETIRSEPCCKNLRNANSSFGRVVADTKNAEVVVFPFQVGETREQTERFPIYQVSKMSLFCRTPQVRGVPQFIRVLSE